MPTRRGIKFFMSAYYRAIYKHNGREKILGDYPSLAKAEYHLRKEAATEGKKIYNTDMRRVRFLCDGEMVGFIEII